MNLILIQSGEPDSEGRVRLGDARAEHILGVLHATPGKSLRVGLLNGPCGCALVEEICGRDVILRCDFEATVPSRPAVDLLLALPRPKVMKRLWAQLAALGVGRIILTNAEKVERFYFDSHVLEPDFYNAHLIEGLQQAGDTLLPDVQIVRQLKPFLEDDLDGLFPMHGTRLLADPSGKEGCGDIFQRSENRVFLAVGPEGGWTQYELELFAAHGFQMFNAGPRILRTDTAVVGLVMLLNQLAHTCACVKNGRGSRE
ncbi:MAG: 16S rRNA (uracil(1498)-N(3))-methyltransferase [Pontiellaceae bacterium]|jgi:RsmE family RNA methyltransferase|nr:16S rRNA (uracil(1498)-N(3))-methyltransferase [Pontiellaceae bacterium]